MIASGKRPMNERGRQVSTSRLKFTAVEQELGQSNLGFFGDFRRQLPESGQTFQEMKGILLAAYFLEMTPSGQQMIDEIERRAHSAASLQSEVTQGHPGRPDYNEVSAAGKPKVSCQRKLRQLPDLQLTPIRKLAWHIEVCKV
jgi:hypothetical protein